MTILQSAYFPRHPVSSNARMLFPKLFYSKGQSRKYLNSLNLPMCDSKSPPFTLLKTRVQEPYSYFIFAMFMCFHSR